MRRLLFFGAPSAFALIVFACASESPKFVIVPDASSAEDGEPATPAPEEAGLDAPDAGGDEDADADAGPIVDATVIDSPDYDALIVEDAGEKIDASGCQSCDCDNDKFPRAGCGDAGEDAATDCDDEDTRYRPNQGFVAVPPDPGKSGDWNCNGSIEKVYPTNVKCALLSLSGCAGAQGFVGDPGCGEEGTFVHCEAPLGLLLCVAGKSETRRQACR